MNSILKYILEEKKQEVKKLYKDRSALQGRSDKKRMFCNAISKKDTLNIIAEIKKASPSKGVIKKDFDVVKIAKIYSESGADAISVLTDEKFFMGSIEYLKKARDTVDIPILRKDFIIDPIQVIQSASINADCILLIAAILSKSQMNELYHAALEYDIEVLFEVHKEKEVDIIMSISPQPKMIGINNRDLSTFETDINTTIKIAPIIPENITIISESGIENKEQAEKIKKAGATAILVGESLMKAKNVEELIKELKSV
jgi:indole-3-glycerol phosphate synthase